MGSNVIGAGGGGGGSANTAYYRLTLEEDGTALNLFTAGPGDAVTIDNSQHYLIGNATFTIQNNNLVMAV